MVSATCLGYANMRRYPAVALVRDLHASTAFERFDRDTFLRAIDARLYSPAAQKRSAEAFCPNASHTRWQSSLRRAFGAMTRSIGGLEGGAVSGC